jgi:outer membrane protein W
MKNLLSCGSRFTTVKILSSLAAFLIVLLFSGSARPVDISSTDLVGFRGGFWRVEKAKDLPSTIQAKRYTPYLELFFSHGMKKGFSLELDLGAGYRGDTKITAPGGYFVENWNLYPISGKIKYSLFSVYPQRKFQPYLDLGLTFLTASSTYNNPYYVDIVYVSTRTALGALGGWGVDFSLSPRILFNLDFQYRWVSFGQNVAGIKNYSGPQLTFGLEYIIKQKPSKKLE